MPLGTVSTITIRPFSNATFSVLTATGLRTSWLAALLMSWLIRETSDLDRPGVEPSSATPMKIVPPSELAKAAISAASEAAFRTLALSCRVLSSPRRIWEYISLAFNRLFRLGLSFQPQRFLELVE